LCIDHSNPSSIKGACISHNDPQSVYRGQVTVV
jgi:hypothetical protein